jgi:hypothetical protein
MSIFLSTLPLLISVTLVVIIPVAVTMGCTILVRRSVGLERLLTNNEVAGFKFAVVGVIYAVLLGFAVVVVWEKFRDAEAAVGQEASAVVAIHRLAEGLGGTVGEATQQRLGDYVETVIVDDWPAMARGRISRRAGQALDRLYAAVLTTNPATPRDAAIMSQMLTDLRSVTQSRRTRLLLATGVVPGVLWLVLFAGAVVTLCFALFFGSPSLRAQTLMSGLLAAIIFMALYVAVEIDHPFTGPVSVTPEAMRLALETLREAR